MSAETEEKVLAEADNPKLLLITASVIVVVVLVIAIVIGVLQFYQFSIRDEISTKELQPPNSLLTELRAKEAERLTSYQYVDKEKGIVRIPVDRAVALTLRDWASRPGGVKAAEAAPGAAPGGSAPGVPAPAPGATAPGGQAPAQPTTPGAPK